MREPAPWMAMVAEAVEAAVADVVRYRENLIATAWLLQAPDRLGHLHQIEQAGGPEFGHRYESNHLVLDVSLARYAVASSWPGPYPKEEALCPNV